MSPRSWTREQLLTTLALYCQTPFGRMHKGNPAIIALGAAIDRTPSAVALKLCNFASLDPELSRRGVGGMGNTSAADRGVWEEFYGRWEVLAEYAVVLEGTKGKDTPSGLADSATSPAGAGEELVGPTEVARMTMQRRGQAFFRAAVLAGYEGKCCVTGITSEALLRASHIVPWAEDPALRLDPRNGLCLNALHDAAFDRGLITFGERFELVLSKKVKDEVPGDVYREMFEGRAGREIAMPERYRPAGEMLAWHRRERFVA